jgi:hypothetical protein
MSREFSREGAAAVLDEVDSGPLIPLHIKKWKEGGMKIRFIDFYSEMAFPCLTRATTYRRAWKASKSHKVPKHFRDYLRDCMRDEATAAVRAVKRDKMRMQTRLHGAKTATGSQVQ